VISKYYYYFVYNYWILLHCSYLRSYAILTCTRSRMCCVSELINLFPSSFLVIFFFNGFLAISWRTSSWKRDNLTICWIVVGLWTHINFSNSTMKPERKKLEAISLDSGTWSLLSFEQSIYVEFWTIQNFIYVKKITVLMLRNMVIIIIVS